MGHLYFRWHQNVHDTCSSLLQQHFVVWHRCVSYDLKPSLPVSMSECFCWHLLHFCRRCQRSVNLFHDGTKAICSTYSAASFGRKPPDFRSCSLTTRLPCPSNVEVLLQHGEMSMYDFEAKTSSMFYFLHVGGRKDLLDSHFRN